MWVWPHEDRGWYSAGASNEVNLGLLGKPADLQAKYHRDDIVTDLQAEVARLEATVDEYKNFSVRSDHLYKAPKTFCGVPFDEAIRVVREYSKEKYSDQQTISVALNGDRYLFTPGKEPTSILIKDDEPIF